MILTENNVISLFRTCCLVAAVSMAVWCCYEFSKNEDLCEVSFKKFTQGQDVIYPDITMCFPNRFSDDKLAMYDNELNASVYEMFVRGEHQQREWEAIDFESIGLDLNHYLLLIH